MNEKEIQYIDNLNKQFIKYLLSQTKDKYIYTDLMINLIDKFLSDKFKTQKEINEYYFIFNSIYIPNNKGFCKIYIGDLITC